LFGKGTDEKRDVIMFDTARVPRVEQVSTETADAQRVSTAGSEAGLQAGSQPGSKEVSAEAAAQTAAEKLTLELQQFNGCGLGREMQGQKSTDDRFGLLAQIVELNAQNRKDDPNLPKLDVIVSTMRGGSAGALLLADRGDIWEADWDANGNIRRNICVKD